jgi:hypothetical protein
MKTAPTLFVGAAPAPVLLDGSLRASLRFASSSESAGHDFLSPFGLLLALLAEEIGRDNFAHRFPPFIPHTPSAWLPLKGLRGEPLYA